MAEIKVRRYLTFARTTTGPIIPLVAGNHFDRIGEVAKVIDGAVYDPNINLAAPGFEMSNGIKRVFWKNTDPYGIYLRTGEQVRFSSLHFQGGNAKRLISQFYRG